METRAIVIVGPTCSGKSLFAVKLAAELNSEIISADSRQVYKCLNIGTAKPTVEQKKGIIHHLIDFIEPAADFNASKFQNEAVKIISNLHKKDIIPIVVGGTGLYIKALIDGIIDDVNTDEEYRIELLNLRKKFGNQVLYEKLKKADPESASKMIPQNWKRVIRALEVYHLTGKPIGYFHSIKPKNAKFDFKQFGLRWERTKLYDNINKRVDKMIEDGLVDEVKSIRSMGFDKTLNSLNTLGYKEIIAYLDGEILLDKAIELIKRNTRRFAKRQMTWFNSDKRINWIDVHDSETLSKSVRMILSSLKN